MPRNYNNLASLLTGRKSSDIPNIDFTAGNYTPAVYQPTLTYTPVQLDNTILERAFNKMEERKEKTNQQKVAIQAAINKVQLNAADENWRRQFVDDISNQIDAAARTGDYSTALTISTDLASLSTSPELLGRERENKRYEEWSSDLNNQVKQGLLDDITRDRLLAQNQYKSVEEKNNNGDVTGIKNWLEVGGLNGGRVETPVPKTPIAQSLILADKLYKERVNAGTRETYKDSQGNTVQVYDASAAAGINSGWQVHKKEEKVLKQIFDEVKRQDPNAGAYIEQMYKDALWEYDTKKQKVDTGTADQATIDRVNQLQREMFKGANPISVSEFLNNLTKESLGGMAYRNTQTTQQSSPIGRSGQGNGNGQNGEVGVPHSNINTQGGVVTGISYIDEARTTKSYTIGRAFGDD